MDRVHDRNWQMTWLFLLALASIGLLMKIVALLTPRFRKINWAFVFSPLFFFSPLLTPDAPRSPRPWNVGLRLLLRAGLLLAALLLYYRFYWELVGRFRVRGLSYFAAPVLLLMGELLAALITLLWLPAGCLVPALHRQPFLARSVADFWSRWNLWFNNWFRHTIFIPLRHRPVAALLLAFAVSGVIHEWVINVPLYLVSGRALFGSTMAYFLIQGAGVLFERRFFKRNSAFKTLVGWIVVLLPVPLVLNEGLLRTLHLWRDY